MTELLYICCSTFPSSLLHITYDGADGNTLKDSQQIDFILVRTLKICFLNMEF